MGRNKLKGDTIHHNRVGHFLPEEDDKFFERVQAAVEEEERQAIAATDTGAAKDAIATAEESRKATYNLGHDSKHIGSDKDKTAENNDQATPIEDDENSNALMEKESRKQLSEPQVYSGAYDSVANLPIEFYHYYHGSNTDMGTLIEVFQTSYYLKHCCLSQFISWSRIDGWNLRTIVIFINVIYFDLCRIWLVLGFKHSFDFV